MSLLSILWTFLSFNILGILRHACNIFQRASFDIRSRRERIRCVCLIFYFLPESRRKNFVIRSPWEFAVKYKNNYRRTTFFFACFFTFAILLISAPASAQEKENRNDKTNTQSQTQTPPPPQSSELTKDNLDRVAASAAQINGVLKTNPGLLVEVKRSDCERRRRPRPINSRRRSGGCVRLHAHVSGSKIAHRSHQNFAALWIFITGIKSEIRSRTRARRVDVGTCKATCCRRASHSLEACSVIR